MDTEEFDLLDPDELGIPTLSEHDDEMSVRESERDMRDLDIHDRDDADMYHIRGQGIKVLICRKGDE